MSDLDNQGCGLSTILGGIIFFVVLYLLRACHNFLNCLVFSWLLYYEMDSFFSYNRIWDRSVSTSRNGTYVVVIFF